MLSAVVAVMLAAVNLPAADWPTFRGSDRSAVSPETGLLQEWPANGPPLLWESQGAGRGYADLTIAGDYIYTLGDAPSVAEDKDEYLLCFARQDGKFVWKTKTGQPWTSGSATWQSSRGTPSVAGDTVCVITAFGELVVCEASTGVERWRKNLKTDFGGKKADGWGYSESPLIDGNQIVVTPGGTQTTMVALNIQSGEVIWKSLREGDRGAGHSSIVISEIGGTKIYVQMTGSGAMGVRAKDGMLLWKHELEKTTAVIPTPMVRGDLVFFAVGYKRGGALLKQIPGEEGKVSIEELYPVNNTLANKHGGMVLVGESVYGDSDDQGIPFSADLMTGRNNWKSRGSGRGSASVAAADGRVYFHFADGTMVLVEANPAAYTEKGAFKVPGSGERPSWSHPVIVDGKLYLREQDKILCYNIRAGQ